MQSFSSFTIITRFDRKRNKGPFNVLLKSEKFQKAFNSLGDIDKIPNEIFRIVQTFVCQLYGSVTTNKIINHAVFSNSLIRYAL